MDNERDSKSQRDRTPLEIPLRPIRHNSNPLSTSSEKGVGPCRSDLPVAISYLYLFWACISACFVA